MSQFEYKVVPAPKKGLKAKGMKTSEDRFAHALQTTMNEHAAGGWEYQRTDTLPSEERSGLTGRVTTFQNMLVFRREVAEVVAAPIVKIETPAPAPIPAPAPTVEADIDAPKATPKLLEIDPARLEAHVAAE